MNSCRYCKYANWARNAKGRRIPKRYGTCTYEIRLTVPACVIAQRIPDKSAIWWERPYEKCPTFQPLAEPGWMQKIGQGQP